MKSSDIRNHALAISNILNPINEEEELANKKNSRPVPSNFPIRTNSINNNFSSKLFNPYLNKSRHKDKRKTINSELTSTNNSAPLGDIGIKRRSSFHAKRDFNQLEQSQIGSSHTALVSSSRKVKRLQQKRGAVANKSENTLSPPNPPKRINSFHAKRDSNDQTSQSLIPEIKINLPD